MVNNNDDGQSLGGSADKPLSPMELRQARLSALENNQGAATVSAKSIPVSSSSPQHHQSVENNVSEQEHDDDPDLQAALALSLETDDDENNKIASRQEGGSSSGTKSDTPDNNSVTFTDVVSFHSIMWDSMMTTDNDKKRWVGQSINTLSSNMEEANTNTNSNQNMAGVTSPWLLSVGSNHRPWGLIQAHGGPCGVLAAVQAELLRILLFGRNHNVLEYPTIMKDSENDGNNSIQASEGIGEVPPDLVTKSLAMAIAIILSRVAITPSAAEGTIKNENEISVNIVLPMIAGNDLSWEDLEPWSSHPSTTTPSVNAKLRVHTIHETTNADIVSPKRQKKNSPQQQQQQQTPHRPREDRIIQFAKHITTILLKEKDGIASPLDSFRRPGGVLLLVMSLVATRGTETIKSDMDDAAGTKLTSQFGHCSQELINLLLTGQAVSNVFDNTLKPSGDLTCRGIQCRPAVGYLSQLESLRYCEVGGYYKFPRFPIYVVGSTSHFTVLFGDATCLKESKSDVLLEKCRRAFKAEEGGDGNGFIPAESFGKVLKSLGLDVGGDSAVQTLAATLEVSGADIILWDDFWKATSRLMTGASLESVLHGDDGTAQDKNNDNGPQPLLLSQHGDSNINNNVGTASSGKSTVESDEELARRLAAEWGTSPGGHNSPTSSIAARSGSPMDVDPSTVSGAMSDEDYARKLQAQWDAESPGTATATDSSNAINLTHIDEEKHEESNTTAVTVKNSLSPTGPLASTTESHKFEFEKFGNSFPLFHYNGLAGGKLTAFRVTRLSAEEAVGASIALSMHSGSSGAGPQGGSGGGDLEDVVRTKFPSSMIDWLGNTPPSID